MNLHALLIIFGNDREAYFFSSAEKAKAGARDRITAMGLTGKDFLRPFNGESAVTVENDLFLVAPVTVDVKGVAARVGEAPLIKLKISFAKVENPSQYFGLIIEDNGAFRTLILSSHANAKAYLRAFMVERGVPSMKIDEPLTDDGAYGVVFHGVIRPVMIDGAGMSMDEPITDEDCRKTDQWLAGKLRSEITLLQGFWTQFGGETSACRHLHDRFNKAVAELTECVSELEAGLPENAEPLMQKIRKRWDVVSALVDKARVIAMASRADATAGNA